MFGPLGGTSFGALVDDSELGLAPRIVRTTPRASSPRPCPPPSPRLAPVVLAPRAARCAHRFSSRWRGSARATFDVFINENATMLMCHRTATRPREVRALLDPAAREACCRGAHATIALDADDAREEVAATQRGRRERVRALDVEDAREEAAATRRGRRAAAADAVAAATAAMPGGSVEHVRVSLSMCEIYNERVRDLLAASEPFASETAAAAALSPKAASPGSSPRALSAAHPRRGRAFFAEHEHDDTTAPDTHRLLVREHPVDGPFVEARVVSVISLER